jgi:hypothetical protein
MPNYYHCSYFFPVKNSLQYENPIHYLHKGQKSKNGKHRSIEFYGQGRALPININFNNIISQPSHLLSRLKLNLFLYTHPNYFFHSIP